MTYEEIQAAQQQLAHNYACTRDHCTPEERAVIEAVSWWYAEINRTRSTSAIHVILVDFEQELFAAVSALLTARAKAEEK